MEQRSIKRQIDNLPPVPRKQWWQATSTGFRQGYPCPLRDLCAAPLIYRDVFGTFTGRGYSGNRPCIPLSFSLFRSYSSGWLFRTRRQRYVL